MMTKGFRANGWIGGGLIALAMGCVAPTEDGTDLGTSGGGKADGTSDFASTYVGRLGGPEDVKHAPLNRSQTVEVQVVSATGSDGGGNLHVESTEVQFRIDADQIVEVGVGTEYPDTTVGFELAYRHVGESDDAFRIIEPPPDATARGGYWARVRLDPVFGTVSGLWRPGEGLEPWTVWGYEVLGAEPNLDAGKSVDALPRSEPLEFRLRVVPLWSPGDLEGLSFEAKVTPVEIAPDHRVVRTEVVQENDLFTARGYDDEDEILIEAMMTKLGDEAVLTAEYLHRTGWREVSFTIQPDARGVPQIVEQSGEMDGTVISMLYTLQFDISRDVDADPTRFSDPVACVGSLVFCYFAAAIVTAPLELINGIAPGAGAAAHIWATNIGAGVCTAALCTSSLSPAWR